MVVTEATMEMNWRAYVFQHPETQDLDALMMSDMRWFDVFCYHQTPIPPGWYFWKIGPEGERDSIPEGPFATKDVAVYVVASIWASNHAWESGCLDVDDAAPAEVNIEHSATCPQQLLSAGNRA